MNDIISESDFKKEGSIMKKIISLILVILCILPILVSCGMSKNPLDIKRNLEDEGYFCSVVVLGEYDDDHGGLDNFLDRFEVSSDGSEAVLVAGDFDEDRGYYRSEKYLAVLFCEDVKSAKKIQKDFIDALDDDDIIELAKDFFGVKKEKNYKAGRNGNVVYIGHKDLIKAAK